MGERNYNPILRLKDSVDVYIADISDEECFIQFYHINTRQKSAISINRVFARILALLDGKSPMSHHLKTLGVDVDDEELVTLIDHLLSIGVVEHELSFDAHGRYSRQKNFLSDWIFDVPAEEAHRKVVGVHCAIFGVGAVGSSIAIMLARAGVQNLTLVDDKKVTPQSAERHGFFSHSYIGLPKVDALRLHLMRINPGIRVKCVEERLLPDTRLESILSEVTVVVNTADEPYIGHTSVKIGRFLWARKIPMYVAGGFDAHLMSSGEFIIPGESPCIDCCIDYFTTALAGWKPSYKVHDNAIRQAHIVGGAGGFYGMSLFSASYAAVQLMNFIAGGRAYKARISQRGEFSIGRAEMGWVNISKRQDCGVCGK